MAKEVLARVPEQIEEQTREVMLAACDQLELHVEEHRGGSRFSIELGSHAQVESLPGVPGGSSFLGTFDREEAVRDESIDFFASGHPFVEGILAHLEESPRGRVALLHTSGEEHEEGFGLLAVYRDRPRFLALAYDAGGHERPDWAERLMRRPLKTRRVKPRSWTEQPGWVELIRSLAARLEERGHPLAVAAFRIGDRFV